MRTIAIIADDLTGAADTGIQFVYAGLRSLVLLDPRAAGLPPADVLVGVTDSRQDSPEVSRRKVTHWAQVMAAYHPTEVYKKIDSTLRGNPGAELDACMDGFPGRIAVFAPAYPAAGRTTINGQHLLHGRPLEETEVSHDPTTPVRESRLLPLLAAQTPRRIAQIRLADLEAGADNLARILHQRLADGAEILVSDAVTDQHLADLVAGVRSLGRPLLWTGSAGLARHVLPVKATTRLAVPVPLAHPLLAFAGSVSQTLRRQVAYYCRSTGAACITADANVLTGAGAEAEAEVRRVAAEALGWLRAGRSTVVTTSLPSGSVQVSGPEMVAAARTISDRLGAAARAILAEGWYGPLFLSGGDTALGVCHQLGAAGIRLHQELLSGIALGTLVDGPYEDLPVITKAGSFGAEDVLCQISQIALPAHRAADHSVRKG
ncbi:MAG: four-carbon acid sugar kinase family protein [Bacillota bacterium]